MDIFSLLNNDISGLSEEERRIAEKFNEENFKAKLADILINGKKGYINMPTKTLIDIYLDKSNEVDFIKLIESIR